MYEVAYSDPELEKLHVAPAFSFLSAVKYVTVLTILLWWLPTLGQMIAGYVGGRRAGSPWRGVAAALLPVALIFVALWVVEQGAFGGAEPVRTLPSAAAAALSSTPVVGPYFEFVLGYAQAFLDSLRATAGYSLNGYLVTLVFAYIGGIFGEQARRELASRDGKSSAAVSITQPILSALPRPRRAPSDLTRLRKVTAVAEARDEGEAEGPPAARRPAKAGHAKAAPEEDETEEGEAEERAEDGEAADEAPRPDPRPEASPKTDRFVRKALRRYDRPAKTPR